MYTIRYSMVLGGTRLYWAVLGWTVQLSISELSVLGGWTVQTHFMVGPGKGPTKIPSELEVAPHY